MGQGQACGNTPRQADGEIGKKGSPPDATVNDTTPLVMVEPSDIPNYPPPAIAGAPTPDEAPIAGELRRYFLSDAYRRGDALATAGTGYALQLLDSRARVYEHEASGARVWRQAMDCLQEGQGPEPREVLFLYLSASGFDDLLERGFSDPGIWEAMMRENAAKASDALPGQPSLNMKVRPYGVLGTQMAPSGQLKQNATEPGPDIAILDPAGLPFIQGSPSGAGGASGRIYEWLGIARDRKFPDDVRAGIKEPLQAKLHAYGKQGEKKGLHVVGPNFSTSPCSRPEALEQLTRAYRAALAEFAGSGCKGLRLLPVSGGIFAGSFGKELPTLTAEAARLGFGRLTKDQQVRVSQAEAMEMCIFMESELAGFEAAFAQRPVAYKAVVAALQEPAQLPGKTPVSRQHCVAVLVAASDVAEISDKMKPEPGDKGMDLRAIRFNEHMMTAAAANCEGRLRRVQESKEQSLGAEHPENLASLVDLGVRLFFRDKFAEYECSDVGDKFAESEKLLKRAYDSCDSALGPDNDETLRSLEMLGSLVWSRGRLEEAETQLQKLKRSRAFSVGAKHPDALRATALLAALLAERRKFADAEPLFRQALAGYEMIFGKDDPRTTKVAMGLAQLQSGHRLTRLPSDGVAAQRKSVTVLGAQGKALQAEAASRLLVSMLEKEHGVEQPDTLSACFELAKLLQANSILRRGEVGEAELLYKRVLAGREAALGEDHPETLQSANALAVLQDDKGCPEEAEPLYRHLLQAWEDQLGHQHPDTLASANNLGVLLKQQGKFSEAEPLYRRVLLGREKNLGLEHAATLTEANNLAKLLEVMGGDGSSEEGVARLDEAEALFQRALAGREKSLGESHADTLQSLDNFGALLHKRGKFKEAEKILRRAVTGRELAFGAGHFATLQSAHNLAVLFQALGRLDEAEPLALHAVRGWEKELGWEHPTTLAGGTNLAGLLKAVGKLEMAEAIQRRVAEMREAKLGPEDLETLASLNNLSVLLACRRQNEEAEAISRRVLQAYQVKLGPAHPDTVQCGRNLTLLCKSLGKVAGVAEVAAISE